MPVNDPTFRDRVLFFETPAVQNVNYLASIRFDDQQPQEEFIIADTRMDSMGSLIFERPLSDSYLPIPNGEIYVRIENDAHRVRYKGLAFDGELPCPINVYSRDTCESAIEFTDEFGPCFSSSTEDATCSVAASEDIFTGTEGELVSDTFHDIAMRSAKYYADVLAYKSKGDDGITLGGGCGGAEQIKKDENSQVVTKSYSVDEQGKILEERTVNYDSGSLGKDRLWRKWKLAQQCDKLEKTIKIDENGYRRIGDKTIVTPTPYECYQLIFDERRHALDGSYDVDINGKKYDTELVGKPEPSKLVGTFVDYVIIKDTGNDGTTDSAKASWWGATGGMFINDRSPYTAGMLEYFDPIWKKAETNAYFYSASYAPLEVFVDDCGEVEEGDKLFTINTADGIKTFIAEMDGYVTYSNGNLHLEVEENKPSFCK